MLLQALHNQYSPKEMPLFPANKETGITYVDSKGTPQIAVVQDLCSTVKGLCQQ